MCSLPSAVDFGKGKENEIGASKARSQLQGRGLSEEDADVLDRFTRTKLTDLNENGLLLKEKSRALLDFYRSARVSNFDYDCDFALFIDLI